jgi:hypothetical protein
MRRNGGSCNPNFDESRRQAELSGLTARGLPTQKVLTA